MMALLIFIYHPYLPLLDIRTLVGETADSTLKLLHETNHGRVMRLDHRERFIRDTVSQLTLRLYLRV